jgi:hypothetical protein
MGWRNADDLGAILLIGFSAPGVPAGDARASEQFDA